MTNDPIADLLTRLRNTKAIAKKEVEIPYSAMKLAILKVLKENGYVGEYKEEKAKRLIRVDIENTKEFIYAKRVSSPGRRMYTKANSIPKFREGMGIVVLSTPKGVLSGEAARKTGQGGEILCEIR